MAIVSHLPGPRDCAVWFMRIRACARALAPLPVLVFLLAPASVRGDIYKWTDERGVTVISNVQPPSTAKTSGMELMATEARPAAAAPGAVTQATPSRTERALQARIENLERQLQAQQAQDVAQPGYPQDYYPAAPPPAPDPNYYGGYDPNYYGSYQPNNYGYDPFYSSGYYPYGVPLAYSYIAVPARPLHRPRFVNRPHVSNRSPVAVSQPPAITGRPPVFTARPPVFATRSQAFVSPPASGFSRSAASSGGAMHSGRR